MLFDEPTSALDPELVGEVLRVMRQLADEGRHHAGRDPRDGFRPRRRQPSRLPAPGPRGRGRTAGAMSSAVRSRSAAGSSWRHAAGLRTGRTKRAGAGGRGSSSPAFLLPARPAAVGLRGGSFREHHEPTMSSPRRQHRDHPSRSRASPSASNGTGCANHLRDNFAAAVAIRFNAARRTPMRISRAERSTSSWATAWRSPRRSLKGGAGARAEFVGPDLSDPKWFGEGAGIAVRSRAQIDPDRLNLLRDREEIF